MRRVRPIRFIRRSALPLGAACVVANGVREVLSGAFAAPVEVRLLGATLPERRAWTAILQGARLYRTHGACAEAVLILRNADACALAAATFGERETVSPVLSPIECEALDRLVALVGGQLSVLCGGPSGAEVVADAGALTTYFELQIEGPVQARVGVGLRRDPTPAVSTATLEIADLADILVKVRARVEIGRIPAERVAALEPGDVLSAPLAANAVLTAAGSVLAVGECGVNGGRFAFFVRHLARDRRGKFVR
jgi:hypothetical protein